VEVGFDLRKEESEELEQLPRMEPVQLGTLILAAF